MIKTGSQIASTLVFYCASRTLYVCRRKTSAREYTGKGFTVRYAYARAFLGLLTSSFVPLDILTFHAVRHLLWYWDLKTEAIIARPLTTLSRPFRLSPVFHLKIYFLLVALFPPSILTLGSPRKVFLNDVESVKSLC